MNGMRAVALDFEHRRVVEREVPPVDVFASPLLPPAAAATTFDAMRDDRKPELIPVEHFRQRLTLYGLVAAAILAWMLVVQQLVSRRRAGPFVRACRELRSLARGPSGVARAETAMRVVHRALDETAGHTVFVDNVDTLFESAHRAPLRARTLAFLDRSRQRFFAGAGEAVPLQELRDLDVDLRVGKLLARQPVVQRGDPRREAAAPVAVGFESCGEIA